ncbi:MAG: tetratricopeptide repeat protein [Cyanobacteria bacterium P01_D01_bin.1]
MVPINQIGEETVRAIAPFIPVLLNKLGEGAVKKAGADAFDQAKALYAQLWTKAKDDEPTRTALEQAANAPEETAYQQALQTKLIELLQREDNLAQSLAEILQAAQQPTAQQNISVGRDIGSGSVVIDGNRNQVSVSIGNLPTPTPASTGQKNNVPDSGSKTFVGREDALRRLHAQLCEREQVAITAINGMGGIGKTELAKQYAKAYAADYPGGICWIQVRDAEVGPQIVEFAVVYLDLTPPEGRSLAAQVQYCWNRWPDDDGEARQVLVVYDDVSEYAKVEGWLPLSLGVTPERFRVLMTTRRQRLAVGVQPFAIEVLSEEDALRLLRQIVGNREEDSEAEVAAEKAVCKWVGYLPLGLELLGNYLRDKPDVTYQTLQRRLESQRTGARALQKAYPGMRAKLGVVEAFELSWQVLDEETQKTACWLSLFALTQIPWTVAGAVVETEDEQEEIEDSRDELVSRSLLQRSGPGLYQLHQLVREYCLAKLDQREDTDELKRAYCRLMVSLSAQMPSTPIRELILKLTPTMSHIAEAATQWQDWLSDDENELSWPFVAMARFYAGQGAYADAEPWYEKCLAATQKRFGEDHPQVATSLNNLAGLYESQGRYEQAEPLYSQALDLRRKLLGEDHPDVATSLNNLAALYYGQGRYEQAEPLYSQALDLSRKLLGEDHPQVATSLNNLAALYKSQGRYEEAEPLYSQALDLRRKLLGEDHPQVATSLNNLAFLYKSQGRYEEAEPMYIAAITILTNRLGQQHPTTQTVLNNFIGLISTVVQAGRQSELSDHPLTQHIIEFVQSQQSEQS